MKRILFLMLLFFATTSFVDAQRVVKVGAFNFYPGIFQDKDGTVKGFYIDALEELGKRENIRFVYVYGSWNEGLNRIQNGEVDMLTSVAYSEERAKYMDYASIPLLTVWGEVYTTPTSHITGILDLMDKTVAVMKADMNGKRLQELAKKLAVNCIFVEAQDFEEVFNLIVSGEVDAGVVNNTFGASKFQEFNLRSSGIVFNPFDIFFTVKKDQNKDLLLILNKYLEKWRHDRNSVYNLARQKWSHGQIGSIEFFPGWIKKVLYSSIFIIVVLILFVMLLRYRIEIATQKVKKSEALFKAFMENLPAFVYIKDENLNHVYQNKKVESIEDASNQNRPSSAKTIFEPHIVELLEQTDLKVLNAELTHADIEYLCKVKDEKMWLHDYKFHIKVPNEKPVIGGISFDISKLKESEFELIKAKERAEESDRLKSSFLANMSHEIRTPLNSIIGFSELLGDSEFTQDQKDDFILHIISNGNNLLHIISDILDISKMESGEISIRKSKVNVKDFLDEMRSLHIFNVEKKGILMEIESNCLKINPDVFVYVDKDRLNQICNNLISNAIKFTSEGSIRIGYRLIDNMIEFQVKDTGIGILPEYHDKIFDRFRQVEASTSRKFGGNGLGLAISKNLVELMGGKIWVDSEQGKGSTFYFTIPSCT